MLRVFFTIVLPLVLPTALYLVWLRLRHWLPQGSPEGSAEASPQGESMHWAALPWVWLAAAGAVLLALMLFVVTVHFGSPQPGTYVPPHVENGQIVPGHIEPKRP
jgi:uncharacterized protein DUF6111